MNREVPLTRWIAALRSGELGDADLLGRFAATREAATFEELVRRHGPMVMGVCRRVLRHQQDAEDAYQAAFLVLARRAAEVRQPERLASWLYGVAYRTAYEARKRARRRAREQQVCAMPDPQATDPGANETDLRTILDQELGRLPEKYRIAVVLCDLEGHTREEAARQLRVPIGTLSGRLTTAHRRLAQRLVRRGIAGAVAGLAAALSPDPAAAAASTSLMRATVETSIAAAVEGVAASGAPPAVVALAEAVAGALQLAKWKATGFLLLLALAMLVPGVGLARHALWTVPPEEHPRNDPPGDDRAGPPGPGTQPAVPEVKRLRHTPIANDMNDIFVVSDVDEGLVDFFTGNRLLVASMSVDEYKSLAASNEPWRDVFLSLNSPNDAQAVKGKRNVPIVPPSDAVRKLIEPLLKERKPIALVIRQEGMAGMFDIVGYTARPVNEFFAKRDRRVWQKFLAYLSRLP